MNTCICSETCLFLTFTVGEKALNIPILHYFPAQYFSFLSCAPWGRWGGGLGRVCLLYLRCCVLMCTYGPRPGVVLFWVHLAHAEGHDVAATNLVAGRPGVNLQSKNRGSGQPAGQLCFLTEMFPQPCRSQDILEIHGFCFFQRVSGYHRGDPAW